MPTYQLALSFTCGTCVAPVQAQVRWHGDPSGGRRAARVKVPCPRCRLVCDVTFDPRGRVLDVLTCVRRRPVPHPSVN